MESCYFLIKTNMTRSTAESECGAQGAALVSIESKEEQEYIGKMIWRETGWHFLVLVSDIFYYFCKREGTLN